MELIRNSLSADIIDKDSVSDILNEIALQDCDHEIVVNTLEIIHDFEIEKSDSLKHNLFNLYLCNLQEEFQSKLRNKYNFLD